MTAKNGLTIENCGKTFPDGTRALQPLSLNVGDGETLVLLGPSGCGKTTLLRIIAGLESPDKGGRVLFQGEDVTSLPIEKRNVGMVFQSYALFPNMTVAQNVGYGLNVRGMPAAERDTRVAEMLAMMHISDLAHRRIDQLSGGQRQRVALARAIAVRPRILLLDEPLTALDALLRDRLRVEINALLRSLGITAIYVTHDQGEAMALADRIVVMDKGRIAQIGSPQEIYRHPQSAFVADFIGSINRLPDSLVAQLGAVAGGEMMIRPQDIEIAGEGETGDCAGLVTSALFLGDRTRLEIRLDHEDGYDIVVESASWQPPVQGAHVSLRFPKDALISLTRAADAA